ncbi:hypothetical protein Tco_1412600 [Tanacetum coccineum]
MLAPKGPTFNGRPTFANLMYLKKAQSEKPCLYEIPHDTSDPANRFVPDREETLTLKKESRSKLNKDLVKPYDYTKQNSLYENFKPATHEYHEQLAHANDYVESLEKEIDELESDNAEFSNMYDIFLQECVSNDVMCSYLHSLYDLDAYTELQCFCCAILLKKYMGIVHFGNDQFAPILGYGDLVQGNITINRDYYVEGLNHNLFSVGQFCDADLEVAFWKSTCFVRDLQGNDLLTGNRGSDLYIISLQETTSSNPICFMAKASPTQAWLWH